MSTIRFMFDGNPLGPEATPSEVHLWGVAPVGITEILIM